MFFPKKRRGNVVLFLFQTLFEKHPFFFDWGYKKTEIKNWGKFYWWPPLVVKFTFENLSLPLGFSSSLFDTKPSVRLTFGKKDKKRIQKSWNFTNYFFLKKEEKMLYFFCLNSFLKNHVFSFTFVTKKVNNKNGGQFYWCTPL